MWLLSTLVPVDHHDEEVSGLQKCPGWSPALCLSSSVGVQENG